MRNSPSALRISMLAGVLALFSISCGSAGVDADSGPATDQVAGGLEVESAEATNDSPDDDAAEFVQLPGSDEQLPVPDDRGTLVVEVGQSGSSFDRLITTIVRIERDFPLDTFSSGNPLSEPDAGASHLAIEVSIYNAADETINVYYGDYNLNQWAPDGERRPGRGGSELNNFEDKSVGVELTALAPGKTYVGTLLFTDIPLDSELELAQPVSRTASLS